MHLPAGLIIGYATILASLLTLIRLYFKKYRNNGQFVFHFAGSLVCAIFIFLMGGWAYISFYLRWLFAALYLVIFILTVQKRSRAGGGSKGIGKWYYVVFRLVFTTIITILIFQYFDGRNFPGKAVDLKFPFKSGNYYVMQGGSNRVVNLAHRNFSRKQYGFAMDISKLYGFENRANGIMPTHLDDYAIYADTVLSPCDGKVILVCDTVHTNIPGDYNIRYVHGNHIIIQCKGYRVFMAHFIKNRIFVKEGMHIKAGQPLGLAGNSGFSAEPHLHINVLKEYDMNPTEYNADSTYKNNKKANRYYEDYRYTGTSSPFTFNDEFYIINDIISR